AECMQIGQLLVDSGQMTAENLAASLQAANGDIIAFSEYVQLNFRVGRPELALAIAQVVGVPAADTKGIELNPETIALLDEKLIRANLVIPVSLDGDALIVLSADPSPHRRAIVEAAAGRPVKWFTGDAATVKTFIERTLRSTADVDRLAKSFEVGEDQA